MRKVLFIILLFVPVFLYARKEGQVLADSLLKELPNAKEDTNKARLLKKLSYLYATINPDEGIKYGLQSLELSEQLKWETGISMACNNLGTNYNNKSDYVRALEYYFRALKVNEALGHKNDVAAVAVNISTVYTSEGDHEHALAYSFKALKHYEEQGDSLSVSLVLSNIASIYDAMGDTKNSLHYNFAALKICERINDDESIASVQLNLSITYCNLDSFRDALKYGYASLKLSHELGIKYIETGALQSIGSTYYKMAADTAAGVQERNGSKTEHLHKAIAYLEQCRDSATSSGQRNGFADVYLKLSDAYAMTGNYKAAWESQSDYTRLKDSVFSISNKVKVANLATQREVELKDKQVEINRIADAKKKNERKFFIAGIILLLLLVAVVIRNYERASKINALLTAEQVNATNLLHHQEELLRQKDLLMKEVHHRVKNNLQVISTLLDLQLTATTDEYAKGVITESASRVRSISLIHQQLYLNNNISSIEFSRFAKDLMQQITSVFRKAGQQILLNDDLTELPLDIDTAVPLALILNELMTNSYKHAFNNEQEGSINLSLNRSGEQYMLVYSDSGPGLPEGHNTENVKTLGMRIMNNLSRQIGGKFVYDRADKQFVITFKDEEGRRAID